MVRLFTGTDSDCSLDTVSDCSLDNDSTLFTFTDSEWCDLTRSAYTAHWQALLKAYEVDTIREPLPPGPRRKVRCD